MVKRLIARLNRCVDAVGDFLDLDEHPLGGLHERLDLLHQIRDVERLLRLDVAAVLNDQLVLMADSDLDLLLAHESAGLADLGDGVLPDLVLVLLHDFQGDPGVVLLGEFHLAHLADLNAQEHDMFAGLQAEAFAEERGNVVAILEQVLAFGHEHQHHAEDQDGNKHEPSHDLVNTGLRETMCVMHGFLPCQLFPKKSRTIGSSTREASAGGHTATRRPSRISTRRSISAKRLVGALTLTTIVNPLSRRYFSRSPRKRTSSPASSPKSASSTQRSSVSGTSARASATRRAPPIVRPA